MKDINLNGLNSVKADKKLIEKTVSKVMNNSKGKYYFSIKKSMAVAATLVVIFGSTSTYSLYTKSNLSKGNINTTALDNNDVTPDKSTAPNVNVTPNSSVAPSSIPTPNKAVADNSVTSNKALADNSSLTSNKPVVTVAPNKATADSNVAPDETVVANNTVTENDTVQKSGNLTPAKTLLVNNTITIPAITLNNDNGANAKMFALVVYNGKIYTESNTQLDLKNIKKFLGEKIGRTVNSIDEWNIKAKSSEELASNIGEQDIYTVKGYDDNFRIMCYSKVETGEYAQFFDCLNGITIKNGKDIFGKLNLEGNIESVKFRTFDDWNNDTKNYVNFRNIPLLNEFLKNLNVAIPYKYETVQSEIDSSKNNNEFREFTLNLKDGSELELTVLSNGYVSYGNSNIYFKVDPTAINKIWN